MLSKFLNFFSHMQSSLLQLFVVLTLTITLSGCNVLTDIAGKAVGSAINPNTGGEISAQVGKTNTRTDNSSVGVNTTTENKAETINQTTNISVEPWVLLLITCLAAGGAIGWVDNIVRIYRRK